MNFIFLGPPGAGKGSLAVKVAEDYKIPHISTGDIFRAAIKNQTELGKKVKAIIDSGALVSDDLTCELVKDRLSQPDTQNGFILDGYPRHMPQVVAIERTLEELNLKVDYAVLLNVEYDMALKRTLGRQICPQCKKTYNKLTGVNAPLVDGMCNDCKIPLTVRNDDNEETFKKGYESYLINCKPVIEYYRNKGILIELDSNGSALDTLNEFEEIIGSKND